MLRSHNVTLEYYGDQDIYTLNVDGYPINLTQDDMNQLKNDIEQGGKAGAEAVAYFLKEQDANLYDAKLIPMADNPNAWDAMEVIKSQLDNPVQTQKPE